MHLSSLTRDAPPLLGARERTTTGKVATFVLIVRHLTTGAPASFVGGVFLPVWLDLGVSTVLMLVAYRPRVEPPLGEAPPDAEPPRRQTACEVFKLAILAEGRVVKFIVFYTLAIKLDGTSDSTWVVTFTPVWIVIAALLLGVTCSCCAAAAIAPPAVPRAVVGGGVCAATCCCLLPPIVLAASFCGLLAEQLDGTHHTSDRTLLGLLVAYQVPGLQQSPSPNRQVTSQIAEHYWAARHVPRARHTLRVIWLLVVARRPPPMEDPSRHTTNRVNSVARAATGLARPDLTARPVSFVGHRDSVHPRDGRHARRRARSTAARARAHDRHGRPPRRRRRDGRERARGR